FTPDGSFGPAALLLQLAGGFIIAVGLVLPGISVSQMLYMLGIYETIIGNISSFHILPLIPLGAGVLGGIFLTTKVLERLMSRHPQPTYLIILGFMFGSLPELFPGIPTGADLAAALIAGAAGFAALYVMSMKEQRT
ncbi:undecaprenyl phosphate translocase family protein, partial [Enterocloster bolteae]